MPSNKDIIKKEEKVVEPKRSKKLSGVALRDSLDKTVKVQVNYTKIHPLYQKRYTVSRKFLVHTDVEVKKNQQVIIEESKPVSKRKSWKIASVKPEQL